LQNSFFKKDATATSSSEVIVGGYSFLRKPVVFLRRIVDLSTKHKDTINDE